MAFRALLFSKSPETDTAMTAACKTTGIRAVVCSDIFTAIEKAKAQVFSCVIANWADQPEASFLLKRARESTPNRNTVAIAIVDHDPSPVEMRENRLDLLIYRPISSVEAEEVLAKASEQMKPLSAEDAAESSGDGAPSGESSAAAGANGATQQNHQEQGDSFEPEDANQAGGDGEIATHEDEDGNQCEPGARSRSHALWFRKACAAILVLIAAFYLWRSREVIEYLAHTREGRVQIFRESVEALFYLNQNGALPAGAAQQDAYFSREPANPDAKTPDLGVVPTESTLTETHPTLPKAPDFPLPAPVLDRQEPPPIHRARAAIPESMRESPPIERPVVVTVNPAQMMPVSAPQPQAASQQFSEPVAVSEEAARGLLIHSVDPVYPPEALAQNLHGAVVLQAVIGRDGSVEDLKIVQGYFALGRAAIAAVKQWRFQPYNVGGHAAATATTITINFSAPPA
jgi:TonB family protein